MPGVNPTNMAECEPKVKLDGAIASWMGPIFFIFGVFAFLNVSYLHESSVRNKKELGCVKVCF